MRFPAVTNLFGVVMMIGVIVASPVPSDESVSSLRKLLGPTYYELDLGEFERTEARKLQNLYEEKHTKIVSQWGDS